MPEPAARRRALQAGLNDLATTHPALAAEWHPAKNGSLTPADVLAGAARKVWWRCAVGHEWEATCSNRSRGQTQCPYCSGLRPILGETDLATTHPDLAAEWHPDRNGDLAPQDVKAGTSKKVWWLGRGCGHTWQATANSRSRLGYGCPYCSGRSPIPGETDLATTHPDLAAEWHPDRNGDLTPQDVKAGTNKKVWWLGRGCGHEWEANPNRRTNMRSGCPFCANQNVLVGFNDLATTHPDLAAQWHPVRNGAVTPHEVVAGSKQGRWWLDRRCGHEWEASVASRSTLGRGCPFCANKAVLAGFNDLATTHPDLAAQWHPDRNGDLTPADVTAGSRRDVWWRCAIEPEHEWRTKPHERTGPHRSGCPECAAASWASAGEDAIAAYVESLGFEIRRGARLEDGERFTYDIRIDSARVLIEYHGVYYHCESATRPPGHHAAKRQHAIRNGWTTFTVWEDDWKERPDVVKRMLAHKLGASVQPRVAARTATPMRLTRAQASTFLVENHIQGPADGSIRLGLEHAGEVVAALVARRHGTQVEILRYATSRVVAGGFGRLMSALVRHLRAEHPQIMSIKTFSDGMVSDGALYERLGFRRDGEVPPDYTYAGNPTGWRRVHKFNYRLSRFRTDPTLKWVPDATEAELAALNGLERVWDAGKTRWVLDL